MNDQERTNLLAWLDKRIAECEAAEMNCQKCDYWYGETHWAGTREAYQKVKAYLESEERKQCAT